jgi:hypothetical protein
MLSVAMIYLGVKCFFTRFSSSSIFNSDFVASASYPILADRLTVYVPRLLLTLGRPNAVALRFASLVVINLRQELHPLEYAHAGRTL